MSIILNLLQRNIHLPQNRNKCSPISSLYFTQGYLQVVFHGQPHMANIISLCQWIRKFCAEKWMFSSLPWDMFNYSELEFVFVIVYGFLNMNITWKMKTERKVSVLLVVIMYTSAHWYEIWKHRWWSIFSSKADF